MNVSDYIWIFLAILAVIGFAIWMFGGQFLLTANQLAYNCVNYSRIAWYNKPIGFNCENLTEKEKEMYKLT